MGAEIILGTVAVFGLLAVGVLFVLARRAVRLLVRLVLAGLLILVLALGALIYWWQFGFDAPGAGQNSARPANVRRPGGR